MKRLLCVFAHPDDECYGPGGAIAQCALDGGEVFVTTFTAGEAGSIGISKTLTPEVLGARRRLEMAAACDALGVAGHRILGVPDKKVKDVDRDWAVKEIISDIRRLRPQIVLTFHHLGVSAHPDHIAVAQFLDEAFAQTTEPVAYYEWGIPQRLILLYQRPHLVPLPDDEITAVVPVSDQAMDRKIAAIEAHVTQYEFFLGLQAMFEYRDMGTPEHFALRRARMARPAGTLTDLWQGIDV